MSRRWGAWAAAVLAILLGLGGASAAAAPRLEFSPARLTFAPRGEVRVVTLHNRGDAPLHLQALGFSADSAGFGAEQLLPQVLEPGQSLAVTVTYVRAGARPQAFGALLVYSDDPGGFDDPRSEERDHVRGVALAAGETPATLWLWLPPLVAAGWLLGRRRWAKDRLGRALSWVGTLLPLLASLWLLWHFEPAFGVPDGNYGIQLGLHRVLGSGRELWLGVDGLSLPLLLLLAAAAVLRLLLPGAGDKAGAAAGFALLSSAGAMLVLCTLEAGFWLVGWELALLGALGRLGGGNRPRARWVWFGGAQLGALLLLAALGMVQAHSLPTALADGTTVAHSADLVKLSYYNYFGDLALRGVPLARPLWLALTLGALLPVLLLPGVPAPSGERWWLSLPLLVLGVYGTLRLAFALLPHAAVALGPWLVAAAVAWMVALSLRALLAKTLPQLLGTALAARAGGIFLGLLGTTQAGMHAALLQLWHHGLAVGLLVLLGPGRGGRGPRAQATWLLAALLILDAPGMLGFVQRTLLVLGVFPGFRLAAVVATAASCLLPLVALRRVLATKPAAPRPVPGRDLGPREVALAAGLGAVAIGLGVWTQPLLDLSRGFVNDLLTHVFSHLDASTIAAR